jgi:hypothetical protein
VPGGRIGYSALVRRVSAVHIVSKCAMKKLKNKIEKYVIKLG